MTAHMPAKPPPAPPGPKAAPPGGLGKVWLAIGGVTLVAAALAIFLITRDTPQPEKGIAAVGTGAGELAPPTPSKAFDHVPVGCDVVVRIDVARLLKSPAAVNHLAPVLEAIATGAGAESPGMRRTTDFLRAAGIDPRRDIGEAILCAASLESATEEQRLAVVFGGSLRPEALVPAVARLEADAGPAGSFDGRRLIRTRSRRGELLVVGQAGDGAIVVSNDAAFFESAVVPNKNAADAYKIPTEPEAAVVVVPDFFARPTRGPEGPLSRHRAEVRRLVITAALAPGGAKGELRAFLRDATAAQALEGDATRMLEGARGEVGDGRLEKLLLAPAKLRLEGAELILEAPWTEANVEQAVKRAAASLQDAFEKGALAF